MQNTKTAMSDFNQSGEYSHLGDLYRPDEKFEDMVPRLMDQIHKAFPDYGFSKEVKLFSGGRSLTVYVISGPEGLSDINTRDTFLEKVKKETERFQKSQGNVLSDYHFTNYYTHVEVDNRYFAQHAVIAEGTEVKSTMTMAAFKRTIKVGDTIILEASSFERQAKMIDVKRKVLEVKSTCFITSKDETGEGKVYFDFPKASEFACDGEKIRISSATSYEPNGFRLYRWIRS